MNEAERHKNFYLNFQQRFNKFRHIETQEVLKGPFRYSSEAFALLQDIELCYAAKAYYACLVLAQSIIETHLARVEGIKGYGANMFKNAGIYEEIEWLSKIRNDIAHGNPNKLVTISIDNKLEQELENQCEKAFKLMHELPIRLQRLRDSKG